MTMPPLPREWEPTRLALQRYAQAITALPRVGAPHDDRWTHVSLRPVRANGRVVAFATEAVPLHDGAELVSSLDVASDRITLTAGEEQRILTLSDGPSPRSVGNEIVALADRHGSQFDVDASRYADDSPQSYDTGHATAWFDNTAWVAAAFDEINAGIDGEVTGPHIWPHGFDLATEWFSTRVVEGEDGSPNAQIAIGFYPAGEPYFYANPWPFDPAWASIDLPHGATWNTDGWFGAKLEVSGTGPISRSVIVELGRFVHDLTRPSLVGPEQTG